jgi:hypothetical protein
LQYTLTFAGVRFAPNMQFERPIPWNNPARAMAFHDTQAIPPSEEIVALATNHLPFGLPRLCIEFRPLALDPPELPDDRQPHRVIGHCQWNCHPHPTIGRVDSEVQVLDGLADDLNLHPADRDRVPLSIHSDSSPVRESYPR